MKKRTIFAIICALLVAIITVCAVSCDKSGEYERFMNAFAKAESFEVIGTERSCVNGELSEVSSNIIKVDKNKVYCYIDEGDVDEMYYVDSEEGSFVYTRYKEGWKKSPGGDDAKGLVSSIKDVIKAESFTYSAEKRAYVGNQIKNEEFANSGFPEGFEVLLTLKNGIATITMRDDYSNGNYDDITVVIKNIGMTKVTLPNVE